MFRLASPSLSTACQANSILSPPVPLLPHRLAAPRRASSHLIAGHIVNHPRQVSQKLVYYRDVPAPDKGSSSGTATVQWFATTHWSVVLAAGHSERKDI